MSFAHSYFISSSAAAAQPSAQQQPNPNSKFFYRSIQQETLQQQHRRGAPSAQSPHICDVSPSSDRRKSAEKPAKSSLNQKASSRISTGATPATGTPTRPNNISSAVDNDSSIEASESRRINRATAEAIDDTTGDRDAPSVLPHRYNVVPVTERSAHTLNRISPHREASQLQNVTSALSAVHASNIVSRTLFRQSTADAPSGEVQPQGATHRRLVITSVGGMLEHNSNQDTGACDGTPTRPLLPIRVIPPGNDTPVDAFVVQHHSRRTREEGDAHHRLVVAVAEAKHHPYEHHEISNISCMSAQSVEVTPHKYFVDVSQVLPQDDANKQDVVSAIEEIEECVVDASPQAGAGNNVETSALPPPVEVTRNTTPRRPPPPRPVSSDRAKKTTRGRGGVQTHQRGADTADAGHSSGSDTDAVPGGTQYQIRLHQFRVLNSDNNAACLHPAVWDIVLEREHTSRSIVRSQHENAIADIHQWRDAAIHIHRLKHVEHDARENIALHENSLRAAILDALETVDVIMRQFPMPLSISEALQVGSDPLALRLFGTAVVRRGRLIRLGRRQHHRHVAAGLPTDGVNGWSEDLYIPQQQTAENGSQAARAPKICGSGTVAKVPVPQHDEDDVWTLHLPSRETSAKRETIATSNVTANHTLPPANESSADARMQLHATHQSVGDSPFAADDQSLRFYFQSFGRPYDPTSESSNPQTNLSVLSKMALPIVRVYPVASNEAAAAAASAKKPQTTSKSPKASAPDASTAQKEETPAVPPASVASPPKGLVKKLVYDIELRAAEAAAAAVVVAPPAARLASPPAASAPKEVVDSFNWLRPKTVAVVESSGAAVPSANPGVHTPPPEGRRTDADTSAQLLSPPSRRKNATDTQSESPQATRGEQRSLHSVSVSSAGSDVHLTGVQSSPAASNNSDRE